jgi:hypothetical protein
MYNLHQACQAEYARQRERNAEVKMSEAGLRHNMELSKRADMTRAEMAQRREHEMENALRAQSQRIE